MAKRIQRGTVRPAATPGLESARGSARGAGTGAGSAPHRSARGRRVSAQVVTEFTLQLATLTGAGIPIVRALGILEGQARAGPFKEVLREVVEDVASGTPTSEAVGKHERAFGRLYSSMVRAGEAGGVLEVVLQRLAEFREKAADIRAKVTGAMIYPVVLVVVATVVVGLVIALVIPKFEEIYASFDVELPGVTRFLLGFSRALVDYWYLFVGLPVAAVLLHSLFMRRRGRYRLFVHGLLLKLPVAGQVMNRALIASFSRIFGTLVQAGVPHLEALAIVRDTSSNEHLLLGVEEIRRSVREGEGIATPMGATGIFDDLVVNMVDVGEETGELDTMLLKVADAYDVQVDRRIDAMFKVLEPALLILMAFFVGFIVFALFMPLMKIMSTLGQA